MLMDIIMESLSSMDEETLDSVLESMSEEEMSVINDYLDANKSDHSDEQWANECIDSLMALDEEALDQVIESLTTEEFEKLETACEKAIDFDKKVYDTRHNPAKFIITPNTLTEAGIPKERADELFDAICDFMAEKKYITCGRKELPEGIAAHFKESRKITAKELTEFGWRYFKKVKAMLLKASKSGDVDDKSIIQNANQKALKAANIEIAAKSALTLIINSAVSLGTGLLTAYSLAPVIGKDIAVSSGRGYAIGGTIGSGIRSAVDYSNSKKSLNKVASRA